MPRASTKCWRRSSRRSRTDRRAPDRQARGPPPSHGRRGPGRAGCAGERSIGHTGTLDPLRQRPAGTAAREGDQDGTVPRWSRQDVPGDGAGSDSAPRTDDLTGDAIGEPWTDALPDPDRIAEALAAFRGAQEQTPPAYSARKLDGERAYARARRGETVALPATPVTVYEVELVEVVGADVTFRRHGQYQAPTSGPSRGTWARRSERARTSRRCGGNPSAGLRVEDAIPLDALAPRHGALATGGGAEPPAAHHGG